MALRQNCQFDEAVIEIRNLARRFKTRRIKDLRIVELIAECEFLANLRKEAMMKLQKADSLVDLKDAIELANLYISHLVEKDLKDLQFENYLKSITGGDAFKSAMINIIVFFVSIIGVVLVFCLTVLSNS
jgi:hypothetical protein